MTRQDDDRARRLAAALRENLKRRKAQARAQNSESSRRTAGSMNTEDEN